jgi:hypothetical protein
LRNSTWPNITKFHVISLFIILLVGWSIFAQTVGVCYYPSGDLKLVSDTSNPYAKYWDWSDTQIMRNFYAGPAIENPIKYVNKILNRSTKN